MHVIFLLQATAASYYKAPTFFTRSYGRFLQEGGVLSNKKVLRVPTDKAE
jgi:hypothetical protein